MSRPVHVFHNGVKVFGDHLTPVLRERYSRTNLNEPEEEGLFVNIVRKLLASACLAGVGTAVGCYALLAIKLRGDLEIHCHDTPPAHIEWLKRNILLNGFRESDFHIHQVAVAARAGTARFLENSYASPMYADLQDVEFLLGSQGLDIHSKCCQLFLGNGHRILLDSTKSLGQPDRTIQCCRKN